MNFSNKFLKLPIEYVSLFTVIHHTEYMAVYNCLTCREYTKDNIV